VNLPTAFLRHRWVLYELTRREIASRYAGSVSGFAWTLLQPLAQLAIFAFVFSQIFRAGVPPEYRGASYTAFVAVALWPWIMFSDAIQRGMTSISSNAGMIRKIALPNELFVYASVLATYAIHLGGFIAVLALLGATGESIRPLGVVAALVLLVPYLAFAMGVALFLAALSTLLKDVEHGTGLVLTIVFYATPILYPLSLVPEEWRPYLRLNPLAYLSERLREVLLAAPSITWTDAMVAFACLAVFLAGHWVFSRLSPHFEEFL
jgi:lipopolysaccharide transport system permease protein